DAARQDDKRHANPRQAEKGIVPEEIHENRPGEEPAVAAGRGRVKRGQHHDRGQQGNLRPGNAQPHARPPFLQIRLRNSSDCSRQTPSTTTALTTRVYSTGTLRILMAVLSVWMSSAPTSEPGRLKRPPVSGVPPITTARIASSSM